MWQSITRGVVVWFCWDDLAKSLLSWDVRDEREAAIWRARRWKGPVAEKRLAVVFCVYLNFDFHVSHIILIFRSQMWTLQPWRQWWGLPTHTSVNLKWALLPWSVWMSSSIWRNIGCPCRSYGWYLMILEYLTRQPLQLNMSGRKRGEGELMKITSWPEMSDEGQ